MSWITQLGQQLGNTAIGSGVNGILGLMFGRQMAEENDNRQYNQASRLGELQLGFNKRMTDYQFQKQMEMWEATNYAAQKEQMKKAGLNPALLYGMGGAGGATVGGGAAQSGGAQHAPAGGGEILGMMQMAQQEKLNQANIELMKSQADLNKAEADKKKGVDTENVKASTKNLLQGVEESEAKEKLTRSQTIITDVAGKIAKETEEEQIITVGTALQKLSKELDILSTQDFQNKNVVMQRIEQAKIETVGMMIDNALKKQQITESQERINKMAQDIMQGWKALSNDAKRIGIDAMYRGMEWETSQQNANTNEARLQWDKLIHDVADSTKLSVDAVTDILKAVIFGGMIKRR